MSHYFFAAKIPSDTKVKMKEEMEKLKASYPFRRWVHHEDLHITLAFLGHAPEDKLEEAKALVKESIQDFEAFNMSVAGLGTFGRKDQPRIFWAGVSKSDELSILRDRVFQACEKAGFPLETRPFSPHITLARNWEGKAPFQKQEESLSFNNYEFLLDEVVLYRTNMAKNPKYEAVEIYHLK
ncbi:RNA 2',3'-cyclic phosphodiesterase [Bacillus sp. EB01]|uniref:RNA 2',3'-cyclic phosphodiesterase n=1 Tax=Bacillus sp. EB01 TaxID=1347086 RepID=UPI0005C6DD3A|nr:RNA 2',3'-cyclic phosphodiesterase [Bacillus sp. EB01]